MKVLVNDLLLLLDCFYEYFLVSYLIEGSIFVGINIFLIFFGISGNLLVCMVVWIFLIMN